MNSYRAHRLETAAAAMDQARHELVHAMVELREVAEEVGEPDSSTLDLVLNALVGEVQHYSRGLELSAELTRAAARTGGAD